MQELSSSSLPILIPQMFVSIFVLMNPFSLLGVYLEITGKFSKNFKKRLLIVMTIAVNAVLFSFLFGGEVILTFFGINLAGFTAAGGILIFLMGISMVRAQNPESHHSDKEREDAKESENPASVGVVPLALPILAGPGTISVVINNAHTYSDFNGYLAIAIGIVAVSIIVYVVFRFADIISNKIGRTGLNIITRVMGLMLMALALDMIARGMSQLFPALS
ncbi:MarC family protein [Nitrosopumilus sp.]|uniref:MarC family protein n=1 Tax=Nitrosopumilus sp. TaxID=2024843 RepID=UPI002931BEE9|nr:MarC family protein [Nitrosopumilus sp.]